MDGLSMILQRRKFKLTPVEARKLEMSFGECFYIIIMGLYIYTPHGILLNGFGRLGNKRLYVSSWNNRSCERLYYYALFQNRSHPYYSLVMQNTLNKDTKLRVLTKHPHLSIAPLSPTKQTSKNLKIR